MNKTLWKKCVLESALVMTALAIGTAAFAWFRVHVVGKVDTSSFEKILKLLPEEWLKFTTVNVEWLISYVGRTAMTLDEPFLVMLVAIWGIVRGSDVVSGEISRGTMEMLLAQPVSRSRVFVIQSAVTIAGVLFLSLLTWLFMWIAVHTTNVTLPPRNESSFWGLIADFLPQSAGPSVKVEPQHQPMSDYVNSGLFAPGILNLVLLGCFVSGYATLISAFDRYRWRTLGIAISIYMAAAMIKIVAMSSDAFDWANWLTFFSLYEPELAVKLFQADPASFWQLSRHDESGIWTGFGPMGHNLWLLASTIGFYVMAALKFRHRDIPAPL